MVFRESKVIFVRRKKLIQVNDQSKKKEGIMEKKYLKKVLTGLSIASLVAGMGGAAMAAGG